MKKKKQKSKPKRDEKPLSPFEKRMSFEEGPIAPIDGKYTMTREEALRQLGFEPDSND